MESQPQFPEFRNNLENFHPCPYGISTKMPCAGKKFLVTVESTM